MSSSSDDVTKIFLSREVQGVFDRFKDSTSAELTKEEFLKLRKQGLVKRTLGGASDFFDPLPASGVCELSEKGIALQAYQRWKSYEWATLRKEARSSRRIAIVSLIIGTLSLLLQVVPWLIAHL